MKSTLMIALATLAAAATALPTTSSAQGAAELAQKKNCMACHGIDKKVVGPGFKEVAAKYAKDKDAVKKLSEKVIKGGSGAWGPVPMPANAQVSEAEATDLVKWVMSLK